MSTMTTRPFSLVKLDFQDLYARHLCRHSQFGINVAHLLALLLLWYAFYALLYWQLKSLWSHAEWAPIGLAALYLLTLAPNVPPRVLLATALFLALFVCAVVWLPELPFWVYLLMIPSAYKLQSMSHRVWSIEKDMTDFDRRYPKGANLFWVLLFYEVPICLNFLLFGYWRS